ncbi:predicted protein [Thalassiosira pseudonana CCMP1335]|uniref:Uncharacterized protein n=1 Tax=Thalassiosira pseudonana TaxID=35128 RepID=B8BUD6_THAPS|nr:predicted protein [Thalassiosira pseudonana CCMP1335]EED95268.1 predicted protein [Thalassiosira pseudonana CCMP1335]
MDTNLTAPHKLTDEESATLRSNLKSQLNINNDGQAEEDAADLLDYAFAMIANGKNVGYVVDELKSMEMEVCDAAAAQRLGCALSKYLRELSGGSSSASDAPPVKSDTKISSIGDGSGGGNALTKLGALGSSRERNSNNNNNNDRNNHRDRDNARRGGRGSGGNNNNNNSSNQQTTRSLHGVAFDRLRQQADNRGGGRDHNQGGGGRHNNNRGDNRGGRDNRGGGRGPHLSPLQSSGRHRDEGGRGGGGGSRGGGGRGSGGRDSRGGRGSGGRGGGGGDNLSGRRRGREEADFIPAQSHIDGNDKSFGGRSGGRQGRDLGGRNSGRFGGRGGGRQNDDSYNPKRTRYEEQPHEPNDGGYGQGNNNFEGGRGDRSSLGRGGRFEGRGRVGRGRGRFSGRGHAAANNDEGGDYNATKEAAAVSESPLVADSFGHSYSGRGGRGRFGGRGRGRGRGLDGGRAGRAEVTEAIKAKTWTRPRTMDEGLSTSR